MVRTLFPIFLSSIIVTGRWHPIANFACSHTLTLYIVLHAISVLNPSPPLSMYDLRLSTAVTRILAQVMLRRVQFKEFFD